MRQKYGSSISYVEDAQQYLLTFVCDSPGDPALGQKAGSMARGAAWFWSTSYDLSDQTQWTPPREISGSWSEFDNTGGCPDYKGYYPSFMSLGKSAGHLSLTGYAFYLWGCQGGGTPGGRQFSSRAFTITQRPPDTLAIEVAKQKGSGKLIVYATSTDAGATLNLTAIPAASGQPPIDLGTMPKTDPNDNEFFLTKKGLVPIGSIEITSTSGGSLTSQLKAH